MLFYPDISSNALDWGYLNVTLCSKIKIKQAKITLSNVFILNTLKKKSQKKGAEYKSDPVFDKRLVYINRLRDKKVVSAEWLAGGHFEKHFFVAFVTCLIITFEMKSSQHNTYAPKYTFHIYWQ